MSEKFDDELDLEATPVEPEDAVVPAPETGDLPEADAPAEDAPEVDAEPEDPAEALR